MLCVQSMASSDMDQKQTETFLVSQTKKRDGGITEQQSKVLLQCWKVHRARVHETVVRSCVWNNRLRNMSWRIDVKSRSRSVWQLNTATAVVELELEKSDAKEQVSMCFSLFDVVIYHTHRVASDVLPLWIYTQWCRKSSTYVTCMFT